MSVVLMGKTGYTCIRHILCGVNLFFWLLGTTILGIGIYLHIEWDKYSQILPAYHVLSTDNLAIVSGALMLLIAFCGCCGSWFQSKCLLVSYLSVIVLIMLLEITAGVLGYVFRQEIKATLHSELMDGIKFKYDPNNTTNGISVTWDHVQRAFNCCGVDHYQDWYKISAWPEKDYVPSSCCVDIPPVNGTEGSTTTPAPGEEPYVCGRDPEKDLPRFRSNGCFKRIRHWILEHLHIVGLTCIIFAFIQFFSIVAALLVVCTMDYKRGRRGRKASPSYNRVPTL